MHRTGQVCREPFSSQVQCGSAVGGKMQIQLFGFQIFSRYMRFHLTHLRAVVHEDLVHIHKLRYVELMIRLPRHL